MLIEARLRTQFAYRNAVANSICLSKRDGELNLLIETRLRIQFAYQNAVANSIRLSKCGSKLNLKFSRLCKTLIAEVPLF